MNDYIHTRTNLSITCSWKLSMGHTGIQSPWTHNNHTFTCKGNNIQCKWVKLLLLAITTCTMIARKSHKVRDY